MLLLIRHAPAGDRIKWAIKRRPDALRPLTPKGKKKFERAARRLCKKIKPKFIMSSEMLRSIQTGEILQQFAPQSRAGMSALLGEEFDVAKMARLALQMERLHGVVVLIGHEPTISQLLAYLLTKSARPLGKMSKGAVACLSVEGKRAKLEWLMSMEQLSGD